METKTQLDIEREIKNLISQRFKIGLEKITNETTLTALGLDSLDEYELGLALEEEYRIEIKDYNEMKKIGLLIKLVKSEYAKTHGGGE